MKRVFMRMLIAFSITVCAAASLKLNTKAADLSGDWKDNVRAGFESRYSKEELKEFMEEVDKLVAVRDKQQKAEALETANESDEEADEYSNFAIADVDKYVNVRTQANTDSEIVGRMYDGAVAQIQEEVDGEDGKWLLVTSGNLNGYIKAEYFIYGDDAVAVIDDYIDRYAVVKADCLNIRENPDIESKRIGYALTGEKLKLTGKAGDEEWINVNYADDKTGFVSADYVSVVEEFIYAKTMDEIKAEEEEQKKLLARQKEDEKQKPENVTITETEQPATAQYAASGDLRNDIVNFALQYVGCPYVHGGNSLTNGTDCSGFTSLVYANFGYGLSRTPSGQLSSNGRSVSLDEIQPGDIVCYGKSKCTHVGIYIGDGQIVHAANPRKGIVVYNVGYDNILGVKNVID
jgi:cell wall-associated NlpC family hydrolase